MQSVILCGGAQPLWRLAGARFLSTPDSSAASGVGEARWPRPPFAARPDFAAARPRSSAPLRAPLRGSLPYPCPDLRWDPLVDARSGTWLSSYIRLVRSPPPTLRQPEWRKRL